MPNTLTNIETATGVAQFIGASIAFQFGTPASATVAYLMGEASWTASTTDLIAKLQNGTATAVDVAQVVSKTARVGRNDYCAGWVL